jgi:hypothetical protein
MAVRMEDVFRQLFMKLLPITLSLKVFSYFSLFLICYSERLSLLLVRVCQYASSNK